MLNRNSKIRAVAELLEEDMELLGRDIDFC